ncbi:hypothetical protein MAM1_0024c02027 [Mucor ambiguus]|uniref:Uncharacterized protein n=1 Tax=Mucor ambiguus TaxID=91626 RepID=A0A0C9ML53_9FUNG|nr:hypothetical protein MAM1_0024c02027 [Mucor ambiguus]
MSAAFFEQRSRASTFQSKVTIEITRKILGHVIMPLNIATNVSFENKNEDDAVDSRITDNNDSTANAVEAKVIHGHAEQEVTNDVALPPTERYSEIWKHLRPISLR